MVRNGGSSTSTPSFDYLTPVTRLSPWNEAAWRERPASPADRRSTSRGRAELLAVLNQLFSTFAPFPDFTLGDLPHAGRVRTGGQNADPALLQAARHVRGGEPSRPLLRRPALPVRPPRPERTADGSDPGPGNGDQEVRQPGELRSKMLDHLEKLCETAGAQGGAHRLLRRVPAARPDQTRRRIEQVLHADVRAGNCQVQEAGQTQLAQVYQAKLAELRAK